MNNTVATAVLGFTAVGLGLFAWAFAFGQFGVATHRYNEDAGASIMQTSSVLVIEHVAFDSNSIILTLYNTGTVPLQITSITASNPNDGYVYDFRIDWGQLDVQEYDKFVFVGQWTPGMVIRVHALPAPLFDPTDPSLNAQWGITVEWKE